MGLSRLRVLNRKWYTAARLLVEEDLPLNKVAEQVGVSVTTLCNWRRKDQFQQVLDAYRNRLANVVFGHGIAQKVNRVAKLNRLAERLETIITERAQCFAEVFPDIPGGSSGLIAHSRKGAGSGDMAEVNDVFELDSALHKAYLDTLEKAQKEMGDFYSRPDDTIKSGPGGSGNVQVNINFPVLSPEQIAEIDNAKVIDLPPQMRRLTQRPSDGMPR